MENSYTGTHNHVLQDCLEYLSAVKSVAPSLSYSPKPVDSILEQGSTLEEVENFLYCGLPNRVHPNGTKKHANRTGSGLLECVNFPSGPIENKDLFLRDLARFLTKLFFAKRRTNSHLS